jgi:flagellar biosynthesis/type III secretory pathway protein FliH
MTIKIHLSNPAVPKLAKLAEELLHNVSGEKPERYTVKPDEKTSRGEALSVIALVISIPSAIVGTMDLVERMGISKQIREFLEKVRKVEGTATLQVGDKDPLDLKTAKEDNVFDLIAMKPPI